MPLIDFILNCASLLLWLSWVSPRFDRISRTSTSSLAGTLKRADPGDSRRWKYLLALGAVLLGRSVVYWDLGPAANWTPELRLGAMSVPFRSDFFWTRILPFSLLSFALMLGAFYLWLILLSAVNARVPDADPLQRLVRGHLGVVERCPRFLKWFLPLLLAGLAFLALHPVLSWLGVLPAMKNRNLLLEQAAVIGLGSYLTWKYLIVGVLLLHLLNSYVYLGNSPLWAFINATAHGLLVPLSWLPLRLGRVDFGPPLAIALTLLAGELAARGLPALYL